MRANVYSPQEYQRAWGDGVARGKGLFSSLCAARLGVLESRAAALKERKAAMQALVERVDASHHCAACRGACCVAGRYHFRVSDLLVFLVSGQPLFTPLFDNGVCPFLAGDRCLMAPPYRPFNCITFNCDVIEDLLPEEDRALFYRAEKEVRAIYAEIEGLLPDRSLYGPLLDLPLRAEPFPAPAAAPPGPVSMQCNE